MKDLRGFFAHTKILIRHSKNKEKEIKPIEYVEVRKFRIFSLGQAELKRLHILVSFLIGLHFCRQALCDYEPGSNGPLTRAATNRLTVEAQIYLQFWSLAYRTMNPRNLRTSMYEALLNT